MGFKKVQLGLEEIITTTIQDESGKKISKWVVLKRDYPDVIKILNKKFGLGMNIRTNKIKRDLDWAL